MDCKIVKVYNNNLVLASDETGQQLVIISKGVGFGRKTGELIHVDKDGENKFFYILDDSAGPSQIQQLGQDLEKLSEAVEQIVELAEETLGIQNENLYEALLDHVSFSIQRLKMGLSIENPFVEEISVLYAKEYNLAVQAAEIIQDTIGVHLGEAECGFIALHLYSARKKKPLGFIMKTPRVYSEVLELIGERFETTVETETTSCRALLLSLDWLVRLSAKEEVLKNPLEPEIKNLMPKYLSVADEISDIVEKEMQIVLSSEHKAYLASDIYRFIQTCV